MAVSYTTYNVYARAREVKNAEELADMNLEEDLLSAKTNSYALHEAALTLEDAFTHTGRVTVEAVLRRVEGLRVTAQRTCPDKLIYRQLYKINESEVELLENHA